MKKTTSNPVNMERANKALEQLSGMKKAEVPPFLFTRITNRIESEKRERLTPRLAWSLALGLALVFAFNLRLIVPSFSSTPTNSGLNQTVNVYPENTLYP